MLTMHSACAKIVAEEGSKVNEILTFYFNAKNLDNKVRTNEITLNVL